MTTMPMRRHEGAFRRLAVFFVLVNLLSPLATVSIATTSAQDATPPAVTDVPPPPPTPEQPAPAQPADPVVTLEPPAAPTEIPAEPAPEEPALTPLVPADPVEIPATCVEGTLTPPSLSLDTPGIAYTVSPAAPYSPGQTVTITATLTDPTTTTWDPAFSSASWTLDPQGNTYSRAFTFTAVPCEAPTDTTESTRDVQVMADPGVGASISSSPAESVVPGEKVTWTLAFTNSGTTDARSIDVSFTVPSGVAFDPLPASCIIVGSLYVSCSVDVPQGTTAAAPVTLVLTATVPSGDAACGSSVTLVARVDPGEQAAFNVSDSITITCPSQLTITTKVNRTAAQPGDEIVYTITVTNVGTQVTGGQVMDELPPDITWTPSIGTVIDPVDPSNPRFGYTFSDLSPQDSLIITISGTIPTDGSVCQDLRNRPYLDVDGPDHIYSDEEVTRVTCNPAVRVNLSSVPDLEVNSGDTVTWTITLTNPSWIDANNFVVIAGLPPALVPGSIPDVCQPRSDPRWLTCTVNVPKQTTAAAPVTIAISRQIPADGSVCGNQTLNLVDGETNNALTYDSVDVDCQQDIKVTKTGNGPIVEGDTMTFTIEVENIGGVTATNVSLSDPLPAGPDLPNRGGRFVWTHSGDGSCSLTEGTSGTLNCSFGDLAPGASKTVTVSAVTTVGDVNVSGYVNTATGSADNESRNRQGNNASTATVIVTLIPGDLTVTLCHATGDINAPYVKLTVPKSQFVGDHGHYDHRDDIWAQLDVDGRYIAPRGNQGLLADDCQVSPDLSITKTVSTSPSTRPIGMTVRYAISVTNSGTSDASNVVVRDPLPEGINWVSRHGTITNGTLTATIGYLPKGNYPITITVEGTIPDQRSWCGTISNTAYIEQGDNDIASNAVETTIPCLPNIGFTMLPTPSETVDPGGTVTWTISLTNIGSGDANNLAVTAVLPPGFTIASIPEGCSQGAESREVNCTVNVPKGTTSAAPVTLAFPGTFPADGSVCGNQSPHAYLQPEDGPSQLRLGRGIDVDCQPDISIQKTSGEINTGPDGIAHAGDTIPYTIVVTNTGNTTLSDITVTDEVTQGTGTFTWADGTVLTIPMLRPTGQDSSASFTGFYTLTPEDIAAGEPIENCATASVGSLTREDCDTVDIVPNFQVDLVTTSGGIDLGDNERADAGDMITYTIVVTNTGDTPLQAVAIDDHISGNLQGTGTGGLRWTYPTGFDGIINNGLTPDQSYTVRMTYTLTQNDIDAGATIQACASVINVPEKTPDDNCADDTVLRAPGIAAGIASTVDRGDDGLSAGDTITYTITVTNTGNTTLAPVALNHALFVNDDPSNIVWTSPEGFTGTIASVPPTGSGNRVIVTGTYTITQEDIDYGRTVTSCIAVAGDQMPRDNCAVDRLSGTPALSVVKTATDVPESITVGTTIEYTFTVTNDGNVTLKNVLVTDRPTAPAGQVTWANGDTIEEIPVGQSRAITATYTVTQADINAGGVGNCATAPYGTLVSQQECETLPITRTPAIEIVKTATKVPDGGFAEDGIVLYTLTVTNTGNVTLTNVTVTDDTAGVDDLDCDASTAGNQNAIPTLQPGAANSVTCTASYTITQADVDAGSFTNTAEVTGTSPQGVTPATAHADDTETVTTVSTPGIELHKTHGEADRLIRNGVVTYTFRVVNTGTVTLEDVGVTDTDLTGLSALACAIDNTSVTNGAVTLAPGSELLCTATYTVTQADVDAGSITNTAEVSGSYNDQVVRDSDVDRLDGTRTPDVSIVTSASPSTGITAPSDITYTYLVSNIGNVTLTNVTVTDDRIADDSEIVCDGATSNVIASLAPGSPAVTCSVTIPITQAMVDGFATSGDDAGWSLTSTGSVTAIAPQGIDPATVTDSDDVTISGPRDVSVTMSKQIESVRKAGSTPPVTRVYSTGMPVDDLAAGDVVSYRLVAINDGDVTLIDVTITDPRFPALSCTVATLAPGGQLSCEVAYTVTQMDIEAQIPIINTATATATDPQGTDVRDTATATATVAPPSGQLALEVRVNGEASISVDEPQTVTYTFTITNGSTVSVEDIRLTDTLLDLTTLDCDPADGVQSTIPRLDVGVSIVCSVAYTVTQEDIDAGTDIVNIASVGGETRLGVPVSSNEGTATVAIEQNPALTLVMDVNGEDEITVDAPQAVTYTYAVTNDGNVTLTDVVVLDDLIPEGIACEGSATPDSSVIPTLAPGSTVTCMAEWSVTQAHIDAGTDIVNVGTATTGAPAATVRARAAVTTTETTDQATIHILQDRGVDASTSSDGFTDANDNGRADAGETITYTIVVRNTGNTTLADLAVEDELTGTSIPADVIWEEGFTGTIASIPVGNEVSLRATYTLTQADIDAGATILACVVVAGDTSAENSCAADTIARAPGLELVKTSDVAEDIVPGDTITYTFAVTNTGNVTLRDVTIDDPMLTTAAISVPAIGQLDPGQTLTVTATYTTTTTDAANDTLRNCATAQQGTITSNESCVTVTFLQLDATPQPTESAPAPSAPVSPSATPLAITRLPNTGASNATDAAVTGPATSILAATIALALIATGLHIRRRMER